MTQSAAHFAAAIHNECAAIEALVEALIEERDSLSAGDTDRLTQVAPRKRELLLHVAHLGEQRKHFLEKSGFTADRQGMERWFQTHDQIGTTQAQWRRLLDLTRSAHTLNHRNGIFIDAGMNANQQALQALMSAGAAANTYGPAGRALNPPSSRSLASA